MHVILGITSYERDTKEVKQYLENLKEIEYLREIKIYDIVCREDNADFIADLLYPSSPYQKLYAKIPSLIRNIIQKSGITLHKPRPDMKRQDFLVRSKACFILKSEDYYIDEKEQI